MAWIEQQNEFRAFNKRSVSLLLQKIFNDYSNGKDYAINSFNLNMIIVYSFPQEIYQAHPSHKRTKPNFEKRAFEIFSIISDSEVVRKLLKAEMGLDISRERIDKIKSRAPKIGGRKIIRNSIGGRNILPSIILSPSFVLRKLRARTNALTHYAVAPLNIHWFHMRVHAPI